MRKPSSTPWPPGHLSLAGCGRPLSASWISPAISLANFPFLDLLLEAVGARPAQERDRMPFESPALESRVVEPVEGWESFRKNPPRWGDHNDMIEDWFGAGEELQHSRDEVEIDEPDRWERALDWVRTLFVAARA
jgi:hypothetical protein